MCQVRKKTVNDQDFDTDCRHANVLYMLFFASCTYSLKKCQLETKRVGKKRQAYNYKKSFLVLLTSLR